MRIVIIWWVMNSRVQIEIEQTALQQLIQQQALAVNQIKCLNKKSKQTLWQTLLSCCQKNNR